MNWGNLNDIVKADFVEAIFNDAYDDNYFYSEATFVEVNDADVNEFINQLNLRKENKGEFCIHGGCVKSLYDCISIFFSFNQIDDIHLIEQVFFISQRIIT